MAVPRLSLLSFFQQTLLDSAACTSGGTARIATDICHLQSFIFPLPASAPITNNRTHSHTYAHRSPSSESPLPKHLCHLSLSSLKPFAALLLPPRRRGMKRTRRAKREREDRGDDSFIWEGSYVLKGAALAAKTFL